MQHKARPASGPKTPKQVAPDPLAHFTATTLTARLRELGQHRALFVAEIIRLEKANVIAAELEDDRQHDREGAAINLLCGNNEAMTAIAEVADVHQKLPRLRRAHRDILRALEIGEGRVVALDAKESGERWRAGKPEYKKRMRAVWAALVQLEKAQQDRDAHIRAMRSKPDVEGGPGWVFVGRLGHTHSKVFQFGRVCVNEGWITEAEFQRDYENAKV